MSNKNIKLFAILFGVILAAVGYYFGYTKLNEKAQIIEAENAELAKEEAALMSMDANRAIYEADTVKFNQMVDEKMDPFPPLLHSEDFVKNAIDLEAVDGTSFLVSDIEVSEKNMLYSTANQTAVTAAGGTVNADPNAPAPVVDETVKTELPMADQQYALTREDMDGMGMTNVDTTSYIYELYNQPISYTYVVGYDDFKNTVKKIRGAAKVQSIDSFDMMYDTETGMLDGTMIVNQYTLTGTDKQYEAPVIDYSAIGNKTPFLTIE